MDAANTRSYYTTALNAQRTALPLIVSFQEERRLTLRHLASFGTYQSDLTRQREETDALTGDVRTALEELAPSAPDSVRADIAQFNRLTSEVPRLRAGVDGGQVSIIDAFSFYNRIIDLFVQGTTGLTQFAPDAETAYQQLVVAPLLNATELMRRSDALAAAYLIGNGLTDADFRVYQGLVSAYRLNLGTTIPRATETVRNRYEQLTRSPAWERLTAVEDALSSGQRTLPVSEDLWRGAARDVSDALLSMLVTQNRQTTGQTLEEADDTLVRSIIAAALVLLLAAATIIVALRLSARLIARLTRLRRETLELADRGLPDLVERVRAGSDVRVEDEIELHGYGGDEIGEVATAFNKAQRTAVAAAVKEAKTKEGTRTVFLNIAHRSQVIVHRQLTVLDDAERGQEDPEQLAILFQLDHLATRARRNAENLIILGGGRPGRRWRNPVVLTELARGASTETEHFARVKVATLPPVAVHGQVVGDLVHLLAELIDNATSFSPPDSRVDVRGNLVGKGVVLEIEDQGIGIEPEQAEELNALLADPPDFGIMALPTEPRLGLFVVAQLAARHGITVTLRESAYGGTRAIVLIRAELLDDTPRPAEPTPAETTLPPRPGPAPGLPSLDSLPRIPDVRGEPGEDLFSPWRKVAVVAQERPAGNGHHQLPQRRRQHHLPPQLREAPPADEPATPDPAPNIPELSRDRFAAFQRGTRRARNDAPPADDA